MNSKLTSQELQHLRDARLVILKAHNELAAYQKLLKRIDKQGCQELAEARSLLYQTAEGLEIEIDRQSQCGG